MGRQDPVFLGESLGKGGQNAAWQPGLRDPSGGTFSMDQTKQCLHLCLDAALECLVWWGNKIKLTSLHFICGLVVVPVPCLSWFMHTFSEFCGIKITSRIVCLFSKLIKKSSFQA